MNDMDIDLVIPMVFAEDTAWQQSYAAATGRSNDTTKHVRYRTWGTERQLIDCCKRFMPWVRIIHLLLSGESQVQPWMERDRRLHIVFHRDFIPGEYLPCFASPCIEMFLHRIPGLAEQFIYANDDMFPLSDLTPGDFFRDGLPCQHFHETRFPHSPNLFERKCRWQQELIAGGFGLDYGDTWIKSDHCFAAILRSSCEAVWQRHGDEIRRHLSPLKRTDRSANHYIYQLYQQMSGRYVDHAPREVIFTTGDGVEEMRTAIREAEGILCLNDHECVKDITPYAEAAREEIDRKLRTTNIEKTKRMETMNKDTRIFICTHTDFECPVTNPVYEIADTRKLFDSANSDGVDELFYSELRIYHRLAQNPEALPKNVGFCQYRKYYEFMDDVPDLEAIIREHGCIATHPYHLKQSVYDQYDRCFYFGDMDIMKAILYETAPELYPTFKEMLDDDWLYVGNMFVMPKENFLEAMDIVWTCLQHYLAVVGKDIRGRIEKRAPLYLKRKGRGALVEHQYRFGGSLGERIMSAYIRHHFENPKTYAIRYTETKARPYRKLQESY